MKKTVIILSILALIAGSCKQATNTEKNNFADVSDSLKINETVTYYFDAKISVINSIADKLLLKSIYAPMGISTDDYSENGLQKALLNLKEQYFSETKADDWDWANDMGALEIYDRINMEVVSKKDNFLTIIYTQSGYAGGAHGFYHETYTMFDLKTGKEILLENIIKNPEDEAWDRVLKDKLAAEYGDIENMLLVDTIPLSVNFYFDEKGITFVYNQYEIASYAAGVISIQIPFKKIENLLTPDFIKRVL